MEERNRKLVACVDRDIFTSIITSALIIFLIESGVEWQICFVFTSTSSTLSFVRLPTHFIVLLVVNFHLKAYLYELG